METTVTVTKRAGGYTALVTYSWGAKVRLIGYETRAEAEHAAVTEIERKKNYTTDKEINLSSSAAAALGRKGGQSKSPAKQAASRENGKKGGSPKKER